MSDRSLDEFANAAGGSDGGADAEADETSDAEVTPSRPTMRWSADGAACDDCGTVVSRRWRDGESPRASGGRPSADDAFVCADCKEW